ALIPSMAKKTLHDVVHEQILEGKTGAAKRGFSPGRSSQLKFPLVTRMSWRGLGRVCQRGEAGRAPVSSQEAHPCLQPGERRRAGSEDAARPRCPSGTF